MFQANTMAVPIYRRQARGELRRAKTQSPPAMAQKERVKPQKGHG